MRTNRPLNSAVVVACLIVLAMTLAPGQHAPLLLFNRTPSLPTGWYIHHGDHAQRGDVVAFGLPSPAWSYAQQRGDSTHVLLIKHVLAKSGDFVSTLHGELRVNGVRIGAIAAVDPAGRTLPHWVASRVLSGDELFVGSTDSRSIDSRYFGPIHADQVIGVYRKLTLGFSLIQSRPSDSIAESHWLLRSPQRDSGTDSRWALQSPSIARGAVDGSLQFRHKLMVGKSSIDLGQGKGRLLALRVTAASIES